jgi:uncharacterized membrane protein
MNKINILGLILIIFQILDGFFSIVGLSRLGIEAEANLLLRSMMEIFGHIPVLIVAKLIGIILILFMCKSVDDSNRKFIMFSMSFIFYFYLIFAIIPWFIVLYI